MGLGLNKDATPPITPSIEDGQKNEEADSALNTLSSQGKDGSLPTAKPQATDSQGPSDPTKTEKSVEGESESESISAKPDHVGQKDNEQCPAKSDSEVPGESTTPPDETDVKFVDALESSDASQSNDDDGGDKTNKKDEPVESGAAATLDLTSPRVSLEIPPSSEGPDTSSESLKDAHQPTQESDPAPPKATSNSRTATPDPTLPETHLSSQPPTPTTPVAHAEQDMPLDPNSTAGASHQASPTAADALPSTNDDQATPTDSAAPLVLRRQYLEDGGWEVITWKRVTELKEDMLRARLGIVCNDET